MRPFVLICGDAPLPSSLPPDAAVAVWDRLDVPEGRLSVPACLTAHLGEIRRELLAWVYDLGRARVDGVEVQERLRCGDTLSMWWCSLLFEKHPKVTPALYPALKLRALERLVEEGGHAALWLHGGDATLHRALRDFCAASGRSFRRLEGGDAAPAAVAPGIKARLRRRYYALPAPCKALGRLGAWLWQTKRPLPRAVTPRPQGEYGTIATYFPNIDAKLAKEGRFRSRYWESLHDALHVPEAAPGDAPEGAPGRVRVNWLFMAFPSPQFTLRQCLALRDAFRQRGGATYHFLEEFIDARAVGRALRRYVRLVRASLRLEAAVRPLFCFSGSRMNLWPYLGQYWADSFRGWRALERCLHREGMRAYTAWAGPQRWTIFPMENCPWERMLTEAVHAAGHGPVYGTQHSTVRPTDFRYFDDARAFDAPDCRAFQPDRLLGNGAGARREMLAAGIPPQWVGEVEALRYMYLAGKTAAAAEDADGGTSSSADGGASSVATGGTSSSADGGADDGTTGGVSTSADGGIGGGADVTPRRLLVVTSFFADEVQEHIRVLAAWMHGPDAGGWEVRIKPHPYLAVEPYLAQYFPTGGAPEVLAQPIGELLSPGVVVWASNSTTVALEAALMGLPVLAQMPADDVDLCPLQGMDGVARIASAAQAAQALRRPTRACPAAGYLALDPALPRWRALLGLPAAGEDGGADMTNMSAKSGAKTGAKPGAKTGA